jgi:hypothetical protein
MKNVLLSSDFVSSIHSTVDSFDNLKFYNIKPLIMWQRMEVTDF